MQQNQHLDDISLPVEESVVLIWKGVCYYESEAIIQALKFCGLVGFLLGNMISVFPGRFRNSIYRFVAKRRYTLIGKSASCLMPDTTWKARFIE